MRNILGFVINALVGVLFDRIRMWWNARQAAYYKQQAEVAQQKLSSLQSGLTVEAAVLTAASTAVQEAEKKRSDHEAMIEELKARAKRRKEGA
jgi:hypothetical protein